jgi:deoxyribodipyrimidine photolyase
MSKFENGLFIFRRDLRIIDNNGLNLLSGMCKNLYTIFIFTPEQVTGQNKYKSNNAVQFMIQSLANLASEIEKRGGKLYTFFGHNDDVIYCCVDQWKINIVGFKKGFGRNIPV